DHEWFTQEVIARGNHIVILVNGKKVVDHVDATNTYRRGHLALQTCRAKTVVRFRKIEIKELPPEEPGWVQLFNGKDLVGWDEPKFDQWKIMNGKLVCKQNLGESLVYTAKTFRDFHLRLDVEFVRDNTFGLSFRTTGQD